MVFCRRLVPAINYLAVKLKLFNTVKAVLNIYHWYWVVSGLSMNIDKIKMVKIVEPRD